MSLNLFILICISLRTATVPVKAFTLQSPLAARSHYSMRLFSTAANNNDHDKEDATIASDQTVEETKNTEMEEIKKEIAQLELTLKNKRRELVSIEGLSEQYSKAGYSRKVAEMDGFRKNRQAAQSDDKSALKASVLQDFLPVLERLNELNNEYSSNTFAMKNYSTLSASFASALKALGIVEFTPDVGSKVDSTRVRVVQEEVSDLYPESGHIISVMKKGYEINGNIVQAAEVVASISQPTE
jgi:molecular chaperone GrpE (heat shock protein)